MKLKPLVTLAALAGSCLAGHASEVYTGIGFPGLALGYSGELGAGFGLRGEVAGGLKLNRDGRREGLDYSGSFKAARAAAFLDWFPMAGSFRLTGGLTGNDIKFQLDGRGSSGTINGKPVDLRGETFNVTLKYPSSTPYLGLGWGHRATANAGIGFFFDLGAQFGSFDTSVQTSLVGKNGITQADVDAEAQKVRDAAAKYKLLPTATLGVSYRF